MAYSVAEIQARIAALVDHDASAPSATSDDYAHRLKLINLAQSEWAQLYDWKVLYKEYTTLTSTATGNVTISMPSDFRKLAGYPRITADGTSTYDFPEISPTERSQYTPTADRFCYILGNPSGGYDLVVNPATSNGQLASSASIYVSYYASAQSLCSPVDVSMCPDPEFLVHRATAYLWQSTEDDRFPIAQAEAEKRLARMLERENTHSEANSGRIKTEAETKYSFRIGRDN